MLTEKQIRKEIERLDKLQSSYHKQLLAAVKTSSTITVMGVCDSMNMAEEWIRALEFVLEENEGTLRKTTFI